MKNSMILVAILPLMASCGSNDKNNQPTTEPPKTDTDFADFTMETGLAGGTAPYGTVFKNQDNEIRLGYNGEDDKVVYEPTVYFNGEKIDQSEVVTFMYDTSGDMYYTDSQAFYLIGKDSNGDPFAIAGNRGSGMDISYQIRSWDSVKFLNPVVHYAYIDESGNIYKKHGPGEMLLEDDIFSASFDDVNVVGAWDGSVIEGDASFKHNGTEYSGDAYGFLVWDQEGDLYTNGGFASSDGEDDVLFAGNWFAIVRPDSE